MFTTFRQCLVTKTHAGSYLKGQGHKLGSKVKNGMSCINGFFNHLVQYVLLGKTMCHTQNPGSYIKGQGHKIGSKVKKGNLLLCSGYNSIMYGWMWNNFFSARGWFTFIDQKLNVIIWGWKGKKIVCKIMVCPASITFHKCVQITQLGQLAKNWTDYSTNTKKGERQLPLWIKFIQPSAYIHNQHLKRLYFQSAQNLFSLAAKRTWMHPHLKQRKVQPRARIGRKNSKKSSI